MLNTLIPISLIITIEIIKIIQGIFIEWDTKLYCEFNHYFCRAKTVSINEEFGNANFIFSDKTGTLTMNQLQFKICIIKNECYEAIEFIKSFKSIINHDNNPGDKLKQTKFPKVSTKFS